MEANLKEFRERNQPKLHNQIKPSIQSIPHIIFFFFTIIPVTPVTNLFSRRQLIKKRKCFHRPSYIHSVWLVFHSVWLVNVCYKKQTHNISGWLDRQVCIYSPLQVVSSVRLLSPSQILVEHPWRMDYIARNIRSVCCSITLLATSNHSNQYEQINF